MGIEMHAAFQRREEWIAARLGEIEFVEIARALKAIADEHGITTGPVIDCLVRKGLKHTLELLADQSGNDLEASYLRHRLNAAGQTG